MELPPGSASRAITELSRSGATVSRDGWKDLAGSVIGSSMDGLDMLILGFMLPAISGEPSLTPTQAGSLET